MTAGTLSGFWIGDLDAELRDPGTSRERVVVLRADPYVLVRLELVRDWLTGRSPHVALTHDGQAHLVQFGTEGEGEGVVTYAFGEHDWGVSVLLTRVHPTGS